MNPYDRNHFSLNPYKGLPDDMIIYKSCYPIKYDSTTNTIQCQTNSIGMNIRIYRMTSNEITIKKQNVTPYKYNIWREIGYYEYIRENVLKPKICPNFVGLYLYYICENCNIDFDKLLLIKNRPRKNIMDIYKKQGLLALTEAPKQNLFDWASKKYIDDGNIKKQVNIGYYNSDIWMSVLFQIIVALYVMQKKKIIFKNFTIEDNVYIKEVYPHENITKYWKYKINGIDYYVPNNGYLVLIDSNYKDESGTSFTLGTTRTESHKVFGEIFEDKIDFDNYVFNIFKTQISSNTFSGTFLAQGGVKPPDNVMNVLSNITSEANKPSPKQNIDHYIEQFMNRFVNNRIGTLLTENEIKHIRTLSPFSKKKGTIAVVEEQKDLFKFVMFLEQTGTTANILTKQNVGDDSYVIVTVNVADIKSYNESEIIVQNYKANKAILSEDELLETYVV